MAEFSLFFVLPYQNVGHFFVPLAAEQTGQDFELQVLMSFGINVCCSDQIRVVEDCIGFEPTPERLKD